ncbi:hypothetical protein A5320_10855 [Rheinheimera sp. SA_1]|jgi:diguanylate cyclase (GGDEF)-like protein|uniref:bifunctional diguanylate cyclase/phosphodiesterase n=1 Tax=Rheinheimera sp. SA_1 TaxID=1827365 RepID=UPI0007FC2EEE|nr:LapD/MoxY N-terminal periplasmic domain-containing protein [Rheinheimera sp. SA_1]OBP14288.1 hypothetical protein A5320_10855 [Rheinheimera sp. SA_1]
MTNSQNVAKPASNSLFKHGVALSTQLSVLLILLAIITFAATVLVSTGNMRSYLDNQLARSAQDTANSLGLSISPYLSGDDKILADTMISAIFDSGSYLAISFSNAKKELVFDRNNPEQVQGVPAWFIQLFPLHPPVMNSEVNDGWRIAGVLKVQAHPGFAYSSLWDHTKAVFWTSLLLCLGALMAVHWLLLVVLQPLKDIEKQAEMLAEKRFEFLSYLPMTKELRAVVYALNHMVGNVKRSFTELTDRAEQLNQQAYIDSLTALPNRRALVQSYLSLQAGPDDEGNVPYLALVALPSLKDVNDNQGYAAGDQYVEKASSLLQAQIRNLQHAQLFRLSGSEFAILATLGTTSSQEFAMHVRQAFEIANTEQYPHGFASIALLPVAPHDDLSASLSRLDGLQAKQQAEPSPALALQLEPVVTGKSRSDWQEILHHFTRSVVSDTAAGFSNTELHISADMERMFEMEVQPVYQQQQLLYVETFIKFCADGEQLASSDVFAMADRLGVSLLLDKALVTYILSRLQNFKGQTFAINLSKSAMHDSQFTRWLCNTIRANQHQLPKLVFEVNEQATLGAIASAGEFFNAVKAAGALITIERFGASFSSFRYLQGLNIDYIKIDGSYIRALQQADTRFFVETMTHICHGIGIRVIAPHVENLEIADICLAIHIDALQGRGLHAPINFTLVSENFGCNFDKTRIHSQKF